MANAKCPRRNIARRLAPVFVVGLILLVACPGLTGARSAPQAPGSSSAAIVPSGPLGVSFSFSPQSITLGSTSTGNVQINSGTGPYSLWFNNTPAGCSPPSTPVVTSNSQYSFQCTPSNQGNFGVNVAVVDSSTPRNVGTQVGNLQVTSSGGNGNGNGNNNKNGSNGSGNGSFSLPSGLISFVILFGIVFLATMVAIAAGTVATAVMVSRQLRRLNETLKQQNRPPGPGGPPG
jgi:hypothetical protein